MLTGRTALDVAAVGAGQVGGKVDGRRGRDHRVERGLDVVGRAIVGRREHADELIGAAELDRVLARGGAPVVRPALSVLQLARKVAGREVLVLAELAEPTLAERLEHKVA